MGIKQYGYYYEKDSQIIEKSVYAGVERDTLSFQDILNISNGDILDSTAKSRFYKSIANLKISIKDVKTSIQINSSKELIDNKYYPVHISYVEDVNKSGEQLHEMLQTIDKSYNKIIKLRKK